MAVAFSLITPAIAQTQSDSDLILIAGEPEAGNLVAGDTGADGSLTTNDPEFDELDDNTPDMSGSAQPTDDESTDVLSGDNSRDGDGSATDADFTHFVQTFEADLKDAEDVVILTVKVEAPEGALPADATMEVENVNSDKVENAIDEAVAKKTDGKIVQIQAVDITFKDADGNEVEPTAEIAVTLTSALIAENEKPLVVHVDDKGKADVVNTLTNKELEERDIKPADDELRFDTEKFSIYGIVITTLDETLEASDGVSYTITVEAPASAGIPAEASLQVKELLESDGAWAGYINEVEDELNAKVSHARLFDISILGVDGAEIQPTDDVKVHIALNNAKGTGSKDADEVNESSNETESDGTENANGSAFATSEGDSEGDLEDNHAVSEGNQSSLEASEDNQENSPSVSDVDQENAAEKPIETAAKSASETTLAKSNVRVLHFSDDGKLDTLDAEVSDDVVTFETDGFSVYGVVMLEYDEANPSDLYHLNDKQYGILNNKNTVSGTAMMNTSQASDTKLGGKALTVRTNPVEREGNVFVAKDSDITMWTFRSVGGGMYNITTEITTDAGQEIKYLKISNDGVSLVGYDQSNSADCKIKITQGTGNYTGKYKLSTSSRALRLDGSNFSSGTGNDANYWMNFAELSYLTEDDFVTYTATKVSVSGTLKDDGTIDYDVKDGDQVIVYTRIWNENTLRYEHYAIDYDGKLVRAYESGDTISWVGTKINTMLWNFTEYHYDDGSPNYYYELQNAYSEKYIAPQVSSNDFLSDSTIGINLNGRRYNEYYSTILAWDNQYYDYASLMPRDGELISVPMSRAADFYFAVMTPEQTSDELTTVTTIDHEPFGITLKMQDYGDVQYYSNPNGYRSKTQVDVLGNTIYNQWTGSPGLLKKNLEENGYPMVAVEGHTDQSLQTLYNNTLQVNQQFLLSTYNETGYFEYDSTQNFAHLITSKTDKWYGQSNKSGGTYKVGDFVIYDQLGTTDEDNKDTLKHGQFLPYNDLDASKISTKYTNEMDIHANPLSSLDPRKGEKLYNIPFKKGQGLPYVDHYFGMEMTASFMQSESGLDAWGHDLIFEFSGDDDFWLYVDGMLVLDLGGIHSALDGSINFRTGQVIVNGKPTNLRTLYREAYIENHQGADENEINEWLNGIFDDDGSNTGTVFKDYSGHTMRMFYMERGAGASNLHMRFNLAPYHDGEVQLEKEVSGTDNISYTDILFPFQIWWRNPMWPDGRFDLLTDSTCVTDAQTGKSSDVGFLESYSVSGRNYSNVFLLKPGQTVSVKLPSEDTEYYFKECGLDSNTFDAVYINRSQEALNPTQETAADRYSDYQITDSTVANRKKVIFNNHVNSSSLKNLRITKRVWADEGKTVEWLEDTTPFRFRIYIGEDGSGNRTVYSFGEYRVKDPEGHYCIYENGRFVSTGETEFSQLSTEIPPGEFKSEQQKATFNASPGGMADNIPPRYTIEIPGLMDGTPFLVEERAGETPAGYQLIDYELEIDGETVSGNSGTISTTQDDPHVTVNNRHGYGLVVEKVWSDAAFMASHDPIYFAVYLRGGTEESPILTLVDGSVRQMKHPNISYTWFFPELAEGKTLNDYLVFEVKLTVREGSSISIDENGVVSGYTEADITRVEENGTLTVNGVSNDQGYTETNTYTANYERETLTAEQIAEGVNFRTDTVKNSRAGIKIVKTDMSDPANPLPGAVFTLERLSGDGSEPGGVGSGNDGDDENDETSAMAGESAKKTFTSDENGLVAVAYLRPGTKYLLTEASSPKAHQALIDPLTIKVESNGAYKVYVNDSEENPGNGYYTIDQVDKPTPVNMPVITIKNKPYQFQAVKVDAATSEPLQGAKFDLYKQRYDSSASTPTPIPDDRPMQGFTDLVSGEGGIIPSIDAENLDPGSYYLREKEAPSGYQSLGRDVHFTITEKGEVKVEPDSSEIAKVTSEEKDGTIVFTLSIKNKPKKTLQILKQSQGDEQSVLAGAEFSLYALSQIEDGKPKEGELPQASGTTNGQGILDLERLSDGVYYLFETKAPAGYNLNNDPAIIMITSNNVTATQGGATLTVKKIAETPKEIWQVTMLNVAGAELPQTGGVGTGVFYAVGILLIVGAGFALLRIRSRNV